MSDKTQPPAAAIKPGGTAQQPERHRQATTGDDEMDAAAKIFRLLMKLDNAARRRIVNYLAERFLPPQVPVENTRGT